MSKGVLGMLGLLLAVAPAAGQELPFPLEMPLEGVESYEADIARPEEVLRHRVGRRHSEPHQIVAYFRKLAEQSERVKLVSYAHSYQGRPLVYAVVTSPANHARLQQIRQTNLRLSESPGEVDDDALADLPVVVYQGYGVHGDEASGPEAALLLLYHLAAGQGEAIQSVLDHVVLLIDPQLNPDGRHRFTSWVNQNRGAVPVADPDNREHRQPWPGGRTNHYWFDPNRDWLSVQHPEGRGRLELLNHWRPQVVTDFHEMHSHAHYFFQPGVPDRVHPHIPQSNQRLTAEMARYHARALDRLGTLYFTREIFDDFFAGKGSTYPDLTGSVGILFEQAASRALERETDHGVLTYAYTVRNQFATSLSTLEAAVAMRQQLLGHQRDFYAAAPVLAQQSPVKAFVISARPDRTRAQLLVQLLQRHRIRVHELTGRLQADGHTFRPGRAWLVPVDQPQLRLVLAALERRTEFKDTVFYDVSTWTLPLAFGLRYAELRDDPAPYLGPLLDPLVPDGGRLIGGQARYGYVLQWGRYYSPRALSKLQQAGIRTRVVTRPISAELAGRKRTFPRGSILVALGGPQPPSMSPQQIHELMEQIVQQDHVRVFSLDTGLVGQGPDLGSHVSIQVLDPPKAAVLTGTGTRSAPAGEVWHLLNERFQIPVSLLDADHVRRADLDRYNTLVLAGGSYERLDAETVKDWVRSGGRLIAIGSGVDWVVTQELAAVDKQQLDLDPLLQDLPHEQLRDARASQLIRGTIFEARLDTSHPLAFGYQRHLPLFRTRDVFYDPTKTPGANVAVYTDEPLMSGYVSAEQRELAPGRAALIALRSGRGRVVLFSDNPNFRAFWYGTNSLFLNALFFSEVY